MATLSKLEKVKEIKTEKNKEHVKKQRTRDAKIKAYMRVMSGTRESLVNKKIL